MSEADFEHRIEIRVERKVLREFLCDLDRYRDLHPLIESIEALPPRPEMSGVRHYRVVDRLSVGPFWFKSVYTATIESPNEHEVRGNARQGRAIHVLSIYGLEVVAGGTRIVERVFIEAPWYLRRYVRNQARAAHRTTLDRMKELLEA